MNKTPSKADIGIDYGLKFFTQLISGEDNDVRIVLLLTFGYIFHFGWEFYVKSILSSQQFLK